MAQEEKEGIVPNRATVEIMITEDPEFTRKLETHTEPESIRISLDELTVS